MLVHANYWRATNSGKLWIMDGLNSNMTISVRDAATVYNQMGSRLLPEIEHELRAWMHFHNRIVEVVADYTRGIIQEMADAADDAEKDTTDDDTTEDDDATEDDTAMDGGDSGYESF